MTSSSGVVVHELPMRWADLDSLNHVNNVVYLDYAAESRAMLVEDGVVGPDEVPSRIAVDFLRPLLLSSRPVVVMSSREGDDLVQEVRTTGSETVFARVVTSFGPAPALEPSAASLPEYALRVRRSDLGADGRATPTKYFEFFQEARIILFTVLGTHREPGSFVVGRVAVTFGEPVAWRRAPYAVQSWVSRVGNASMTIESEIVDGGVVHAHGTAVLVGFDLATQSSRQFGEDERAAFAGLVPQGQ